MNRVLWATLLLVTVPLAGCTDGGDDQDEDVLVAWDSPPSDATTGEEIDFTWALDGPEGEIAHTGVHWGPESVDDPTSPADYPESAGVTEPADVPGEYDASVTIDDEGTYYFRAHAIAGGTHVWSNEVSIVVTTGMMGTPVLVTLTEAPADDSDGTDLRVAWRLTGVPGEIAHTGFHWGSSSVDDPSSPADYGNNVGVTEPADVPGNYSRDFSIDADGTYYGRAHAIKDGSHYWSDEVSWTVAAGNGTGNQMGTEHTIEMLDVIGAPRFEPDNITVSPGDTITWVNNGALDHTATFDNQTLGDSGNVAPGANYTLVIPDDMEPGTYDYICAIHEQAGMTGTIVVEA